MFHPRGPTIFELARQALSSTERGYDLLAPKFDYTPFRTPSEVLQAVGEYLAAQQPIDAALDVCCGTGAAMEMLRPHCRRIVGIDRSHGMLDVAQDHVPRAPGDAQIEFVRGEVLQMPFANVFDLAVCFGALGHILPRDEPDFIDQVARVLRPGGRFVFVTTYLPSRISPHYWLARGFNAAMHVRNFVVKPPFIMYYLTFLLPRAQQLLQQRGFTVEIVDDIFPPRYRRLKLVIATKAEETAEKRL
ncbi:MAG: class I SAM-dependent methyltransferase [Pirellulaceae bacterium]